MISYKKGEVVDIIREYNDCIEISVNIDGENEKAVSYNNITGKVDIGDEVILNTTAVELGLGTGGVHFVVSVKDGAQVPQKSKKGHIMKLRYTPMQFSTLSVEEEESPYHKVFKEFKDLEGMPVIIGELHSMLPPVVFNIKRENPDLKIAYIMTDGGALPLDFSRSVSYLKEKGLLDGTITFGQAFGGDLETVNIYTALIAAYAVLKCDIAIVMMGPGITGTGTKYGFSGVEQGAIIDAVNTLGGDPFFIPRISFADKRKRHRGISHHSITVLKDIAKTLTNIVLPKFEEEKIQYIKKQIKETSIGKKHNILYVEDANKTLDNISSFDFKVSTMGRGLDQEREFFKTAGIAGLYVSSHFAK